jgi:tellurite resistance protein
MRTGPLKAIALLKAKRLSREARARVPNADDPISNAEAAAIEAIRAVPDDKETAEVMADLEIAVAVLKGEIVKAEGDRRQDAEVKGG